MWKAIKYIYFITFKYFQSEKDPSAIWTSILMISLISIIHLIILAAFLILSFKINFMLDPNLRWQSLLVLSVVSIFFWIILSRGDRHSKIIHEFENYDSDKINKLKNGIIVYFIILLTTLFIAGSFIARGHLTFT